MTAQDYVAGNALHRRRRLLRAEPVCLAVIAALIYGAFVWASLHGPPAPWFSLLVHGTVAVAIALFLLSRFVFLPYFVRKAYREQPRLHVPVTASWSDSGFTAESEMWHAAEVPWTGFLQWTHDRRVLILYQTPRHFVILPRRELDAEQAADICACLRRTRVPQA